MRVRHQSTLVTLSLVLASSPLMAQIGTAVPNWTVPPYSRSAGSGLTTMDDLAAPALFIPVTPCRVVDTRNAAGPYGGPALATNTVRVFDIDSGPCPGIPANVYAYSLNFGGILPPADGFLTAWPTGLSQPVVSQLNLVGGEVVANAAIVPVGTDGTINVLVNIGPTNIYVDINGYFGAAFTDSNHQVYLQGNTGFDGHLHVFNTNTGASHGILGKTNSTGNGSSGILGFNGSFRASQVGSIITSGVRGEASTVGIGVLGLTRLGGSGVGGYRMSSQTDLSAGSELGFTTTVGLQTFGTTAATGMKSFVEPHPTDPSKMIRYTSLEGNEPGTYFRGKGRFQNGVAVISVPEDFRIVTDPDGLSIQVTPIGQMATVAVQSIGLDRIVVRGSRNVEFFYTVNGIRQAYRDASPIVDNEKVFVPRSADEPIPTYLPEALRQRLISNGTYRPDGTVNRETARREGWERTWEVVTPPARLPESP